MGKIDDIFQKYGAGENAGEIEHWNTRWSRKDLKKRKGDIGTRAFSRGYRLNAVSDEDLTFSYFYKSQDFNSGVEIWQQPQTKDWVYFMGVDISSSTREGCVMVTVAVNPDGHRYWREVKCGAWKSPQFVKEILSSYNEFRHSAIYVENNAVQTMLTDWLEDDNSYLPVQGYHTGKQKADPKIGLPSLDVEFEHNNWTLPMKLVEGHDTIDCKCNWCRLIKEFVEHPQYKTTDIVMACFTPETRIWTKNGYKPIADVCVGEEVMTHTGNWRKVLGLTNRAYKGTILEIRPWGMISFNVTPEHPLYAYEAWYERADRSNILKPTGFKWIEAANLKAGRKHYGDYLYIPKEKSFIVTKTIVDLGLYLPIKTTYELTADSLRFRGKRINRYLELDYEFGWVVGFYLAEGTIGGDAHKVVWATHDRETKYRDKVKKFMLDKGIMASEYSSKKTKGTNIYVSCKPLANFFKTLGKKNNKNLTPDLLYTPMSFQKGVLDGYFSGDGHICEGRQHAVSTSKGLIDSIILLLQRRGIWAKRGNFKQKLDKAMIAEKITLDREQTKKLQGKPFSRTNLTSRETQCGYMPRIRSIKQKNYNGMVYNLHVETDNSYCIEGGLAVHNSWFAREAIRNYFGKSFMLEIEPDIEGEFL